jgi:hypothetical protein
MIPSRLTMTVIFGVKSYNIKGQPAVFSVPQINLIPPPGVSTFVLVKNIRASSSPCPDKHHYHRLHSHQFMVIRQLAWRG